MLLETAVLFFEFFSILDLNFQSTKIKWFTFFKRENNIKINK